MVFRWWMRCDWMCERWFFFLNVFISFDNCLVVVAAADASCFLFSCASYVTFTLLQVDDCVIQLIFFLNMHVLLFADFISNISFSDFFWRILKGPSFQWQLCSIVVDKIGLFFFFVLPFLSLYFFLSIKWDANFVEYLWLYYIFQGPRLCRLQVKDRADIYRWIEKCVHVRLCPFPSNFHYL